MRYTLLLTVGAAAICLGAMPASAQLKAYGNAAVIQKQDYDHTKPYPPYTAPRLAIGQPDLQGVWSNATLTNPNRPRNMADRVALTEEEVAKMEKEVVDEVERGNARTDPNAGATARSEAPGATRPEFAAAGGAVGGYNRGWLDPGNTVMRVNGQPRTSLLTTPNGAAPAAKAGAAQAQGTGETPSFWKLLGDSPVPRGQAFDNPESRGNGERCIISFGRNGGPPMFANGFYNNNYQIVQSPDSVAIIVEMNHDARIVRLNSKHRTDDIRPYFGDSIGWFEGDTLVVETNHMPRTLAYSGSWKNLTVTERFKRVAPDRLYYSFEISDPTFWDKPWGGEYEFHPLGAPLYEYACHEGNYALHGILSGARVQEEAAAKAKAVAAPAAAPAAAAPAAPKPRQ